MSTTGYARVSTGDQNIDTQIDQLRTAGCTVIYADTASGRDQERPEWKACLRSLGAGDTLVVTRIDRLGRSLIDLVNIINDLARRNVSFRSLAEGIDTSNAQGMMMFQLVAVFAEYERRLIRERTKEGLLNAKRNGSRLGRPRALTHEQVIEAQKMRTQGYSFSKIAHLLGSSPSTVRRYTQA